MQNKLNTESLFGSKIWTQEPFCNEITTLTAGSKPQTAFFNPNHDYCVAKTGYLVDKAGPSAPDSKYSMLGSW